MQVARTELRETLAVFAGRFSVGSTTLRKIERFEHVPDATLFRLEGELRTVEQSLAAQGDQA